MNILEKEIEDLIWDCIQKDKELLKSRGLHMIPTDWKYYRQVNLGSYGIADMIAVQISTYSISIIIYELKKDAIEAQTFFQAARYAKALQRMINRKTSRHLYFSFCLIGKSLNTSSDFCFLPDVFDNIGIYTYKIDLERGLCFNRQYGFKHTSESLPKLNFSISDIKEMFNG